MKTKLTDEEKLKLWEAHGRQYLAGIGKAIQIGVKRAKGQTAKAALYDFVGEMCAIAFQHALDLGTAAATEGPKKSGVGVHVRYCGHDASFIADIIEVGNACVVVAPAPITDRGRVLHRPCHPKATHHLVDFPTAGYWSPSKGLFVVPNAQVKLL